MNKKRNKTVSSAQIPERYRASRPKIVQLIGRWFLRIFNWKVEGQLPSLSGEENIVIIAGPHTSNWDGVFGFAALLGLDAKITFFGKHTLFKQPILGRFLYYMGGIPVDKTKPGAGLTAIAIENMKQLDGSLIAMAPEGTRAKTEKMKSGFLRIAHAVNGKIFLASFDFKNKRVLLDRFFEPSDNDKADMEFVREYFTNFKAKIPENY